MQTQALGRQGAAVTLRILNGEKPHDIKNAPVAFGKPVYDWRELQHWELASLCCRLEASCNFESPQRGSNIAGR